MKKLFVIGNLGQDCELKEVNGKFAIKFSLAVNERFLKNGVAVEKTTWVNCTMWKDNAAQTKVAEYLKQGTQVHIEGTPEVGAYINKEGKAMPDFQCRVIALELLGASKNGEKPAHAPVPAAEANDMAYQAPTNEDMPF